MHESAPACFCHHKPHDNVYIISNKCCNYNNFFPAERECREEMKDGFLITLLLYRIQSFFFKSIISPSKKDGRQRSKALL